eukprot:935624_1
MCVGVAAVMSFLLICTCYISCTVATTSSPISRYLAIEREYVLPIFLLRQIRTEFAHEMIIGLNESDDLSRHEKVSSLAMLSSHVPSMPTGKENGIYYALDWGGSNYRVSRIQFLGKSTVSPQISFHKQTIPAQYKQCDNQSVLFDYLALILKNVLIQNGDDDQQVAIGFTFSFPIHQLSSNIAILKEWRKGFDIPGVIGQNVVSLMHDAFARNQINAKIHHILNDAASTLLSCAYYNRNARVGMIIATGTNAAYIEPNRDVPHHIIHIEWGSFISKLLTPYLTSIDLDINGDLSTRLGMRKYAENQFITKLMSGTFIGELVRRLMLKVYGEHIGLNDAWSLQTERISDILRCFYENDLVGVLNIVKEKQLDERDAVIIAKICQLIVNRSADLAATMLLATLEKSELYWVDADGSFVLSDKYSAKDESIGVGIDGSVYQNIPRYKERMLHTMTRIVGAEIVNKIEMISAKDESGVGAALSVATANLTDMTMYTNIHSTFFEENV